jgi:hypothetical protein
VISLCALAGLPVDHLGGRTRADERVTVAARTLRVITGRAFPPADAAAACACIESRHSFGRVLLKP